MPLYEMCAECRNFFTEDIDKHRGFYQIKGGTFPPLGFLLEGQFFRIVGSTFNDGIHRYPDANLTDETFSGEIWAMRIPPAFLELSERIDAWTAQHGDAIKSPYLSESFGGYSYTKAASASGSGALSVFAAELNKWRKL